LFRIPQKQAQPIAAFTVSACGSWYALQSYSDDSSVGSASVTSITASPSVSARFTSISNAGERPELQKRQRLDDWLDEVEAEPSRFALKCGRTADKSSQWVLLS